MLLEVKRLEVCGDATIGELWIDGKFFCLTLEDLVRDEKIYGKTAIPAGEYKGVVNMSNRFKRWMIEILNVPNYAGVRMHGGNKAKDTLGCVLVAYKRLKGKAWIYQTAERELTRLCTGQDLKIVITNIRS